MQTPHRKVPVEMMVLTAAPLCHKELLMSVLNITTIHPVVVKTFQCGLLKSHDKE